MEKLITVTLSESEVQRLIATIKPVSKSLGATDWDIAQKLEAALRASAEAK